MTLSVNTLVTTTTTTININSVLTINVVIKKYFWRRFPYILLSYHFLYIILFYNYTHHNQTT